MTAPAETTTRILHLSLVLGRALTGRADGRLGRGRRSRFVRLGDVGYPPVTAALATVAGRPVFVPADSIAEIDEDGLRLTTDRLDLRPFERRPQEVLLAKDVLDRQLIDVDGARLRRANDIELARLEGWWRVVGVDVGPRGIIRRVVPRRYAERLAAARGTRRLDCGRRRAVHRPRAHRAPEGAAPEARAPAPRADRRPRRGRRNRRGQSEILAAACDDDPELEADLFGGRRGRRAPASCSTIGPTEEVAAVLARMGRDGAASGGGARGGAHRRRRRDDRAASGPPCVFWEMGACSITHGARRPRRWV